MTLIPFLNLPDESQLWAFGIERCLNGSEEKCFLKELDVFLETWSAHGQMMICGRELRHSRFLFVAVDLNSVPPSGCSIDGLVHFLKNQEMVLKLKILDNSPIWYRNNEQIKRVGRSDFKSLAEKGAVSMESIVFDNSIGKLFQLRNGQWEKRVRESWHKALVS